MPCAHRATLRRQVPSSATMLSISQTVRLTGVKLTKKTMNAGTHQFAGCCASNGDRKRKQLYCIF
jgi:hypothetical protein